MLELRNIVMKYGNRVIYDRANFKACDNELTVVMGKSGSGKSTLHHIITFQHQCVGSYFYNDIDVDKLSDIEKNNLLQKHFGIVHQVPAFINDLTVRQHIELCQSLNEGYDVEEYIKDLCLEETLNKYPLQLSGGEKIRVAVLLSLVHQPDVLVFDEPTSSLDRHHSQIIVDMMKKYAHSGHISIIFTHDSLMKEVADRLYYIEDKQLTMNQRQNTSSNSNRYQLKTAKQKSNAYFLKKMFENKKLFKITTLFVASFMIALTSFSIFYGNSTILYYINKMNATKKEGVVFKENSSPAATYPYDMSNQEYSHLLKVKHIEDIWPLISVCQQYDSTDYKIYNGSKVFHEVTLPKGFCMQIGTYNEKYDYDKEMYKTFQNDGGIYIDGYSLFRLFYPDKLVITSEVRKQVYDFIDTFDENMEIEFTLPVPLYSANKTDGFGELIFVDKKVKKKIKGIFMESDSRDALTFGSFTNAIGTECVYPLSEMLQLIEENKPSLEEYELNKIYYTQEFNQYFDYFKPLYYQFIVENGVSFNDVKEDIELSGLRVESHYSDAERNLEIIKQLNSGMRMISTIISVITLFILFGIKYNQRNEYRNYMQFFTDRGYSMNYAKKHLMMKFSFHAVICMMMSFIIFVMIVLFYAKYYVYLTTSVNFIFMIFIILMSICIEVILPLLVTGKWEGER